MVAVYFPRPIRFMYIDPLQNTLDKYGVIYTICWITNKDGAIGIEIEEDDAPIEEIEKDIHSFFNK